MDKRDALKVRQGDKPCIFPRVQSVKRERERMKPGDDKVLYVLEQTMMCSVWDYNELTVTLSAAGDIKSGSDNRFDTLNSLLDYLVIQACYAGAYSSGNQYYSFKHEDVLAFLLEALPLEMRKMLALGWCR